MTELEARVAMLEKEKAELQRECARLKDHERFVDSIVENLPDMVFVKDATELRFVRFNAAGEALLGRRRDELIGHNDFDFFPESEASFFVAKDREVLAGRSVVEIAEEPIHTPRGLRFLHTKKIPIVDDRGRPLYLLGISEDVTEKKAAAEELLRTSRQLRASEHHLRLLLGAFPGAMWTTDASLRISSVAGGRMGDLGLEGGVGELAWEHLPPGGPDVDVEALHRRALAGETVGYEFHHDGHTSEVRLERLPEEAGAGVIGVALDVTERRRVEAERLRVTIERTQRMETLGMLAGGIAHDFNNLLAAILGNASLALLRLPEGHPARTGMDRVVSSAETAADLTRQLLAYSGKGRFVVEPLDLSKVVEGIAGLLRVSLDKNAELRLDLAAELPACAVDGAQIRQVVLNLLTNANDALGGRAGHITIATSVVHADRSYLEMAWLDEHLPEGRYVCLEVSDTGVGMDQATMNRMFDPFFTTKAKGHGLGLAATLGIIRGHRGAVRVYSEPGRGTTIKVLLPASASPRHAPTPDPPPLAARGGRVLVVDDEEPIRAFVSDALHAMGYDPVCARDGVEALEIFRVEGDRIDLVLLDMTMPRMSGEETFRELRRLRPEVLVLLSSGYNEQDATSRFAGKGLAGFLQKPYRAADLLAKIDHLLARRETI